MKTQQYEIRFATEDDVATILDFITGLAIYEKMLDEVVATEEILRESLFNKKQAEVILLEIAGKAAGFALFFHNYSTFSGKVGLYLEDIFVHGAYRGNGYGKALFQKVAEIAAERDCGRMEWSCLDWNEPSIQFYKSQGAVPMDGWSIFRLSEEKLKGFKRGN